jgi:predicted transcriptional regulator
MKDPLDLEIKRKIYKLILNNPGLHVSRIAELLEISWELLSYHLYYLEKNDLINVVKKDGYNRCFPSGKLGEKDRKILSILRQKNPLAIIIFLLMHPYSKFKEILDNVDVAPSTLSYHLQKLIKKDILEFEVIKNEKRFLIKDRKYVIQLLVKYKPYSMIDGYEEMWSDFLWSKDLF